jgi:hypothetical protein
VISEAKANLLGYLWQQFPATIGHIPLGEKIDEAINQATEKLTKENEEIGIRLAEVATEAQNYKIEWNCCKDEIQTLTTRIKELEAALRQLFYCRIGLGIKVEEQCSEADHELWKICHRLLNL